MRRGPPVASLSAAAAMSGRALHCAAKRCAAVWRTSLAQRSDLSWVHHRHVQSYAGSDRWGCHPCKCLYDYERMHMHRMMVIIGECVVCRIIIIIIYRAPSMRA